MQVRAYFEDISTSILYCVNNYTQLYTYCISRENVHTIFSISENPSEEIHYDCTTF